MWNPFFNVVVHVMAHLTVYVAFISTSEMMLCAPTFKSLMTDHLILKFISTNTIFEIRYDTTKEIQNCDNTFRRPLIAKWSWVGRRELGRSPFRLSLN